jgi:hypothetical protein
VHLRNDDAFRAVDDEVPFRVMNGTSPHIDVLFLDVLNRLCTGFLINIENDETKVTFKGAA